MVRERNRWSEFASQCGVCLDHSEAAGNVMNGETCHLTTSLRITGTMTSLGRMRRRCRGRKRETSISDSHGLEPIRNDKIFFLFESMGFVSFINIELVYTCYNFSCYKEMSKIKFKYNDWREISRALLCVANDDLLLIFVDCRIEQTRWFEI